MSWIARVLLFGFVYRRQSWPEVETGEAINNFGFAPMSGGVLINTSDFRREFVVGYVPFPNGKESLRRHRGGGNPSYGVSYAHAWRVSSPNVLIGISRRDRYKSCFRLRQGYSGEPPAIDRRTSAYFSSHSRGSTGNLEFDITMFLSLEG